MTYIDQMVRAARGLFDRPPHASAPFLADEDVTSWTGNAPEAAPTLRTVRELGLHDMDLDWD